MSEQQQKYGTSFTVKEPAVELAAMQIYHRGEARRWGDAARVADVQGQTLMHRRYLMRQARHRRWAKLLAQIARS